MLLLRYTDRIMLHKTSGRQYDPSQGKTVVTVDEGVVLPCNLSRLGIENTATVFGSVEKEVVVARLQFLYTDDVDKAVIDDQKYKILKHIPHKRKSVFYLEGVEEWT